MRRAQGGAALILFATILVVGAVWFTVGALGRASPTAADRDIRTGQALSAAKRALLGYVAQYAARTDHDVPGRFPCPEPLSPASGSEGVAALNCPSAGPVVGRLPWRTLGIQPLLDGSGEPLWYVLSPGFRDPPVNFATPAALNLDAVPGAAVALVVAPGAPLNTLLDPGTPPSGCTKRNQAGARFTLPRNPLDFLECGNTANAYVSAGSTKWINDRAIAVTAAEWADTIAGPVGDRIQRSVAPALRRWNALELAATGRSWPVDYLPYASPFGNPALNGYCGSAPPFGLPAEGLSPIARVSTSCDTAWSSSSLSLLVNLFSQSCTPSGTEMVCSFISLLAALTSARISVTTGGGRAAGSFRRPLAANDIGVSIGGTVQNFNLSVSPATGNATATFDVSFPLLLPTVIATVRIPNLSDAAILSLLPGGPMKWFLDNRWERHTYYAAAPGATVNPAAPCANPGDPGCLVVTGFDATGGNPNDKRLVLVLMGRRLAGQPPICTSAADCLEGENASSGDRTFARAAPGPAFNDRLAACPFQLAPQPPGLPVPLCN